MSIANLYILAMPMQSDQAIREQHRTARQQVSVVQAKAETKPGQRLWKICAETASPWLSALESIAFLLLGASTFGALVCCFTELLKFAGS
jgi:hypothetical protein